MPENAIIFDMDGTLVDSLSGIAQATNNILKLEGHPVHPIQNYQQFVGYGIDQLLSRAIPADFRHEDYLDVVLTKLSAEYSRTWRQHGKLYPGIGEMLSQFNGLDIPLAILSNKPHNFTIQFAEHYLSNWHFEEIAGASPNYPRKPAPDKAVKLANQLGIAFNKIFFVGDSNIDILTAQAAGMIAVGVSWGFRSVSELRSAGAGYIIDTPAEMIAIVNQQTENIGDRFRSVNPRLSQVAQKIISSNQTDQTAKIKKQAQAKT